MPWTLRKIIELYPEHLAWKLNIEYWVLKLNTNNRDLMIASNYSAIQKLKP
jgi:hypothetical protein